MQKYLHYWVNLHGWGMFYSIFFYSLFYRPVGAHPVYEATWAETELRSSASAALYLVQRSRACRCRYRRAGSQICAELPGCCTLEEQKNI